MCSLNDNPLNETADPERRANMGVSLDLRKHIRLDVMARWVDHRAISNAGQPATVPAYCEIDTRIAWQFTKALELSLVGQNLLHDNLLEYGVPGPGAVLIRRNLYGELACRL